MNKRIRELAEQAEFSEKDLHIQDDNFQKFAELIVRECMDTVSNCKGITKFDHWIAIKEHFGVE